MKHMLIFLSVMLAIGFATVVFAATGNPTTEKEKGFAVAHEWPTVIDNPAITGSPPSFATGPIFGIIIRPNGEGLLSEKSVMLWPNGDGNAILRPRGEGALPDKGAIYVAGSSSHGFLSDNRARDSSLRDPTEERCLDPSASAFADNLNSNIL